MRKILLVLFFCALSTGVFAAEEWERVYLASFPRSGNHWTRFLLEEATGVVSGSVYADRELKSTYPHHDPKPLPWGGFTAPSGYQGNRRYPKQGETVVIKTHYPVFDGTKSPYDCLPHKKIIRIARHPVDAIYSWYVYDCQFHGTEVQKMVPHDFVADAVIKFKNFQEYYNQQPHVETFLYEAMLEQPETVLGQIAAAIGYQLTKADIKRAVEAHPPQGKPLKHFDKYTSEDLALMQKELSSCMQQFGYTISCCKS